MNAIELEARYIHQIRCVNCLLLLPSTDAKRLVGDCASTENVRLLGVEAYRVLDDERVQPGIEFSNISFGRVELIGGELKCTQFERGLREPWDSDPDVYDNTKKLIDAGIANGYPWFEVSIEDLDTNDLLFFREHGDKQADEREPD